MTAALAPRVHAERCIRYRFRYSECGRCSEACPYGALHLSDEGVAIDGGACRHCGLCVGACPTEAFQSATFSRPALVRAATEVKSFTIACSPSGSTGDAKLPCLGVLDATTAIFLLSNGTDIVLAGNAHCAECAHGEKARAALALLSDAAVHACEAFGNAKWGRLTFADDKGEGVDRFGTSRRQFFRRLAARGVTQLTAGEESAAVAPAKAVRAAAHYRPLATELFMRTLGDGRIGAHPAIFAARVEVGQGACTGCELCERVCPTGALRCSETEGEWHLLFAGHCVGCGACVEACQPAAIRFAADIVSPRTANRLHVLPRTRCKGCGRIYIGEDSESACPVCNDDERNFSAIFG